MRRGKGGPQTAVGRRIASRNALRHGLAAVTHRPAFASMEIKNFSDALCAGERMDPGLMAAVLEVAECEMALRAVRAQTLAVIERLDEVTAIALRKGDNGLVIGQAKYMGTWILSREIETLVPKLMEKYQDQLRPSSKYEVSEHGEEGPAESKRTVVRLDADNGGPEEEDSEYFVPYRLRALLGSPAPREEREQALEIANQQTEVRDEHEALEEAMPDLLRLARYERQAFSRLLRAIRKFANAKLKSAGRLLN